MKIIVIGAGNWGTTLAIVLSKYSNVSLWTEINQQAKEINKYSENKEFLPGIKLPKEICVIEKYKEAIDADGIIIFAVPSSAVRNVAKELREHISQAGPDKPTIISASKGFDHESFKTMSQVIKEVLPQSTVITLSGPNIASEISKGKPAKAVLACEDISILMRVKKLLKNDVISFELSKDVTGIELCAALKGIIAIAVGIADGLGLDTNFQSLIMTYGLREFVKIAEFLLVSEKTIYGIAGLGDLIATCVSKSSRNHQFGYLIGQGMERDAALREVGMVVEGVKMSKTIINMEDFNLSIPLITCINKIIFNHYKPEELINAVKNMKSG